MDRSKYYLNLIFLQGLLYFIHHGFGFLKSEKTASSTFTLIIPSVKTEHSATYYCACWVLSGTVRLKLRVLYNNPQSKSTASSQTTHKHHTLITTLCLLANNETSVSLFANKQSNYYYNRVIILLLFTI